MHAVSIQISPKLHAIHCMWLPIAIARCDVPWLYGICRQIADGLVCSLH